jgi:hypothetical protein
MIAGGAGGALQIQGARTNRQDVRTQNVMAVLAVANIVKSSLGPVGLDKVHILPWSLQIFFGEMVGRSGIASKMRNTSDFRTGAPAC